MDKKQVSKYIRNEVKSQTIITQKEVELSGCDHKIDGSKNQFKLLESMGNGVYRCQICGETVDLNPRDISEVKEAAGVLASIVQYLKLTSTDKDQIKELGDLLIQLKLLPDTYANTLANSGIRDTRSSDYYEEEYEDEGNFASLGCYQPQIPGFEYGRNYKPKKNNGWENSKKGNKGKNKQWKNGGKHNKFAR